MAGATRSHGGPPRSLQLRLALLAASLLAPGACTGRRSAPPPPGASASAAAAALPSPPPGPAASAPAAPPPRPAPTSMTARELAIGDRPVQARVTLIRTEPDRGALLLNESTGDFVVVTLTGEGDQLALRAPGLEATLRLPGAPGQPGGKDGQGTLRFAPAVASAAAASAAAPAASAPVWNAPRSQGAPRLSPGPHVLVGPDGAGTDVATLEGDPLHRTGAARAGGNVHLWHHDGRWLVVAPDVAPRATLVGGQPLRPTGLEPGREPGCLVHGLAPSIEGPMAEVMAATWKEWVRERCASGGPGAIVELSYRLVALAGVNLPDFGTAADPAHQPGPGRAPASTMVVPLNLRARVTTEGRSGLVEEAFLIDAAAGALPRLGALLAPDGRARIEREALEPWTVWEAGWLRSHPLARTEAAAGATLAVGPTSIDLVVPLVPYGLVMPTRHIPIGPRSTLAPAFVSTAATRRLTAAVNVDY